VTVLEVRDKLELPLILRVGIGATPIDAEFIDECGDCALWDELEDLFFVRLESL
jgi:hypothetical protein